MGVLELIGDEFYPTVTGGAPLPFVAWPSVVLGVIGTYLMLIKLLLPAYMANRKPYDLRGVMLTYNGLQFCLNLYVGIYVSLSR